MQTARGPNPGPGWGCCTLGGCRQTRDGGGAGAPQALQRRPCPRQSPARGQPPSWGRCVSPATISCGRRPAPRWFTSPRPPLQDLEQHLVLSGLFVVKIKPYPPSAPRVGTDPRASAQPQPGSSTPACLVRWEHHTAAPTRLQAGSPQSSSESSRSCSSSSGPWASRHGSWGSGPASVSGLPSAGRAHRP